MNGFVNETDKRTSKTLRIDRRYPTYLGKVRCSLKQSNNDVKTDSPKWVLTIIILQPFHFLPTTLTSFIKVGFKHVKHFKMTV